MNSATSVFDALEELRLVALDALDADLPPLGLHGAPACSYVSPGPPPWDVCPCLIAYTPGLAVADTFPLSPSLSPGHRAQTHGQVNLLPLSIAILRCAWQPSDEAPMEIDGEGITASARQTSADLFAIWNHIRAAKSDGTLFGPREREFFFDPTVPIATQGGCVGWQINVRTELDGYPIV